MKRNGWCLVTYIGLLLFSMLTFPLMSSASDETITLNFITYENIVKNLRYVVEEFEKRHPNIHINLMGYPFHQMFEVIETKMKAHSKDVDILNVDVPLVANYTVKGYLEPLDKYFTPEELAEFTEVALEASMYNGRFMAAPLNSSSVGLFCNVKLFKKHGVPLPSTDPAERWTWKQVVEAAQKLTIDTNGDGEIDIWGFAFDQVDQPYQILPLANSLGGVGISPDGLRATGYINTEPWIEAAQFYQDLFHKYKVSPVWLGPFEAPGLFAAGKLAMILTGPWHIGKFNSVEGLEWIYAPHPYFEKGKPVTPTGSWHLGVSKYSEHKAEAALFVKFITLHEGNLIYYKHDRNLPANKLTLEYAIEEAKEQKNAPILLAIYESTHTAVPRPKTPGYLEWATVMAKAFADIRKGLDPKTVLDRAAAEIDRLLIKYREVVEEGE